MQLYSRKIPAPDKNSAETYATTQKVPMPNDAPTVTAPAALFLVVVELELDPEPELLPVPVVEPGDEAPVAEARRLEHVLAAQQQP